MKNRTVSLGSTLTRTALKSISGQESGNMPAQCANWGFTQAEWERCNCTALEFTIGSTLGFACSWEASKPCTFMCGTARQSWSFCWSSC